jgi:hypothetical protein
VKTKSGYVYPPFLFEISPRLKALQESPVTIPWVFFASLKLFYSLEMRMEAFLRSSSPLGVGIIANYSYLI